MIESYLDCIITKISHVLCCNAFEICKGGSNTQSNIVVQDKILRRHYGGQLFTIFYLKVKQTSENNI